jgi:hypothetical protein
MVDNYHQHLVQVAAYHDGSSRTKEFKLEVSVAGMAMNFA